MEAGKKIGRGLDEIYHLFLSHQNARDQKEPPGTSSQADAGASVSVPSGVFDRKGLPETVSGLSRKRASSWLFYCNRLFAEKSIVVCNLALELSRRGFSVGVIETTTEMPNVFFLLGSLLTPAPPRRPLELIDISPGYSGILRAVFLDKDLNGIESVAVLNRLMSQSDFLVINVAADISLFRGMIALADPLIIVPAAAYPEELLESYLLIKKISNDLYRSEIGHLIVGEQSYSRAEAASGIIAEMARKFIRTDVRFLGTVSIEADVPMAILTRRPALLGAPNSPFSVSIRRVADALIGKNDHLKKNNDVEADE
jgi:hypothetical protein